MHTLAAAQQVAVTASTSLSRSSPLSFLRHSGTRSALSICKATNTGTSSSLAPPPEILCLKTGFRVSNKCLVANSGKNLSTPCEKIGYNRVKRSTAIRSFASRKDRQEGGGESAKLDPDIASLRSGFSKKFPGQDAEQFTYDWDSDGSDDEVDVKSFKSGSYGRAQSSSSASLARAGYNLRSGLKPDSLSRPGRSLEKDSYERRKAQRNVKQAGAAKDAKGSSSSRSAGGAWRESGSNDRRLRTGGSWPESGDVDRAGNSGERRGADSTLRTLQGSDRNSGNRETGGATKESTFGRPDRRGRKPYGGGDWSKDTPVFEDEEKKKRPEVQPVHFGSAMSKDPHVAILGGGMSGLMCALTLEEHGIQSTVFDTGKHGLGGRMGTRYVDEYDGEKLIFDHAAQFFTVTDARFQKVVDRWISEGAVKEWRGNVGTLRSGGHFTELPHGKRYIGTNGMRSLADHMLSKSQQTNVKRPCWISSMEATVGLWKLTENRRPQGEFDVVVIAHNGKCANRLLSTAHVPLVARQMKRLELSSIWALLAAFKEPLPQPRGKILDGAFVEGVESLSWMGNNSKKLVLPSDRTPECWTFFSTAVYGKRNKVPQESIPIIKAQKVKHDILQGVEIALGLSIDSLPTPLYTRLQLWGAALPTNTPGVPCIFDAHSRVGICGDWLVGSSLEAAALSGMALADHIAKYRDHGGEGGGEFSIGLQESFNSVTGCDIGQFPGTEELSAISQEMLAV